MVTIDEMRELERSFVERGGDLNELTRRVGFELARAIKQQTASPRRVVAYLGKGYNAADAVIALQFLAAEGWPVGVRLSCDPSEMIEFTRSEFDKLGAEIFESKPDLLHEPLVVLDALLGIGAKGAPGGALPELIREMNELGSSGRARVIAVDVPTGLDADSGEAGGEVVRADVTCCVGEAKLGLVRDQATKYVGRMIVLRVAGLGPKVHDDLVCLESRDLTGLLRKRPFGSHKGSVGRVAIVAGSDGMWGAANLCARAAFAAGAGMVTLYCPEHEATILQIIKPDEAVVRPIKQYIDVASDQFDALVVGPGMRELPEKETADLWKLIQNTTAPTVMDAGGMYFGIRRGWNMQMSENAIITPHPGEMRRLFKSVSGMPRVDQVRNVITEGKGTLVLKGARTLVGKNGEKISVNISGGPGMAIAGQGDSLSGIIAALAASGIRPFDAARLGVWLAGRAGERAGIRVNEFSATTSDMIGEVGNAINDLRLSVY